MSDIFQNSRGLWAAQTPQGYRYYATEQEARTAMAIASISENPIEVDFARTIVGEFLPALRKLYLSMIAMQVQWHDESFQAALAAAERAQMPLAGFPAQTWSDWGTALLLIQKFIEAPREELGGQTILSIVLRRYVAQEAQA